MAHTCPDCGELCYCNGDIDDCEMDTEDTMLNCEHWRKCDQDYSEEEEE